MTSQQTQIPRGNKKTLIIGFDFGTHSTKVVLRERGRDEAWIAELDDCADGYPRFASPSVVRQIRDRLFFGTAALRSHEGTLLSSLKVKLLTEENCSPGADDVGLDSATLVSTYLAWAFQRVREKYVDGKYANVLLNLAAPMSHYEDPKLKARYLRIVQAAWSLSFEDAAQPIEQGTSVANVANLLGSLMVAPVQAPEQRRFDVLPETIAPVVSLSLDPWMESGMYMIVDTGAGTTEMSVFHAGNAGADQKVLCYCDETMLLGGNDLQWVEKQTGNRRDSELQRIISRMTSQYTRLWSVGYSLDSPNRFARRRWKELTLVLSGGGTRHDAVAGQLSEINPMHPWTSKETRYRVCRHVPGTLELNGGMDSDDGSLFAVANGLAIERKRWPIIFQPNQIERLDATEASETSVERHWCLDSK